MDSESQIGRARPLDREMLRRELLGYHSMWEDPAMRARLVAGALPRIAGMFELLPDAGPEGRLLELGAAPFFNSLCLDSFWPGTIVRTNYSDTGPGKGQQRLLGLDGRPDKIYEFDEFDIEKDVFPYPDEVFDVVVFSEVIEHLAVNPVWTLSEIHRVLKPNGNVIITTPNALALERLATYLFARSEEVDRYAPFIGYGGRHNHEWMPSQLRDLFESTGFDVETMVVRDLAVHSPLRRLARGAARLLLRSCSEQSRAEHIFFRARRRNTFRWTFPPDLFQDTGMYTLCRHPFVEMGRNDAIQLGPGWLGLETSVDEEECEEAPLRRLHAEWMKVRGYASMYLCGLSDAKRLVLRVRAIGEPATVELSLVGPDGDCLLDGRMVRIPTGRWTDESVSLSRAAREGEHLELVLKSPNAIDLAVRRVWLDEEGS